MGSFLLCISCICRCIVIALSRSVARIRSTRLRPLTDKCPIMSWKLLDAFAMCKSIVKNAAGSEARVEIESGGGKILASDAEALSGNLGPIDSAGWDLSTRYGWVRRRLSSKDEPIGGPGPYREEIGLLIDMRSGAPPNLAESYLISRSSRNRGRPRFLCWTSTHATSFPVAWHLAQGRWAIEKQVSNPVAAWRSSWQIAPYAALLPSSQESLDPCEDPNPVRMHVEPRESMKQCHPVRPLVMR